MVFSYYISYIPYQIIWRMKNLLRKRRMIVLHLDSEFDLYLFKNIGKYLNDIDLVVTSKSLRNRLRTKISSKIKIYLYPAYPNAVIMFRNAAWKYPVKRITKIGLTHGAYNFKRFPKSYYYNMFDLFLITSEEDAKRLEARGVKTAKAIGYPKSDSLIDGSYSEEYLKKIRSELKLVPQKLTLLFTATWDRSGMSAIDKWYDKLSQLTDKYNIIVNLHYKMSSHYRAYLKDQAGIHFIEQPDIYPYIMIADICISDTSSLLAEFCIADKPIITFSVDKTARTMDDVSKLIKRISVTIDEFDELPDSIEQVLAMNEEMSISRMRIIKTLISPLDGKAGERAALEIIRLIPELKRP